MRVSMLLGLTALILAGAPDVAQAQGTAQLAFPGAVGPAAKTPGGRGGRIIRVVNLNPDGPGSFKAALDAKGPRIIVFEVGGVIDMGRKSWNLTEPFVTIAGQTAPSPGITLIKGGIDVKTHDVVMRHIRIRTGADNQPKRSGWEADSFSTVGAYNVIVDHCTFSWAIDENMSASGPRFTGQTVADWRKGTSHDITFQYNAAYEGLADSSHPKGEHSKGSLIHDNATGITIWRNLYAHNVERNALFKGGAQGVFVNNLIYDPGKRALHYNLMALEWEGHPYVTGEISAVGNVMRGGPSTTERMPFFSLGGDGDLRFYGKDNIVVDREGAPLPMFGRYGETRAKLIEATKPVVWVPNLPVLAARDVETHVLANAGARPWDRDADDIRVFFFVAEGRGAIIDDEKEVSAYPAFKPTAAKFVEADWNLDTMEPKSGRYPGQTRNVPQETLSARDAAMRK